MNLEKKNNINYTLLTNLVFSFFPISFILGNLIINLNLLLFCCLGIFHLKSRILKIKFDLKIHDRGRGRVGLKSFRIITCI